MFCPRSVGSAFDSVGAPFGEAAAAVDQNVVFGGDVDSVGGAGDVEVFGRVHVIQLRPIGSQANFDVWQRLTPCQLRKCHDPKQIGTTQSLHPSVTSMPTDDATEIFPWHEFQNLRKQRFANCHA